LSFTPPSLKYATPSESRMQKEHMKAGCSPTCETREPPLNPGPEPVKNYGDKQPLKPHAQQGQVKLHKPQRRPPVPEVMEGALGVQWIIE